MIIADTPPPLLNPKRKCGLLLILFIAIDVVIKLIIYITKI